MRALGDVEAGEEVYEWLLRVHAEEVRSRSLARVPEELLEALASHASSLRRAIRMAAERSSVHQRMRERELEVLRRVLADLLERRLAKVVEAALEGRVPENAMPFELQLHQEFRTAIDSYMDLIHQAVEELDLRGKAYRRGNVLLVFTEDHPAVTDEEGRRRGPFRRGSLASLPPVTALLALDAGKARRIPSPQRSS